MSNLNLSQRQIELLIAVVGQLGQIQVDWATVAIDANYTTAKYARDTWTAVKNKISAAAVTNGADDDGAGTHVTAPSTPKAGTPKGGKKVNASGKKRKKSDDVHDEHGDGDDANNDDSAIAATPNKKAKTNRKTKAAGVGVNGKKGNVTAGADDSGEGELWDKEVKVEEDEGEKEDEGML